MVTGSAPSWIPDLATRAEAAIWVARLHADTRTDQDDAAFREWLAEKPENALVFDRMTATWDAAGAIGPFEAGRATVLGPPRSRRKVLAGIAAAVSVMGGFGAWTTSYASVFETAVGERREVMLDDGSRLMLDTATSVRVSVSGRSRHLSLERGRINLAVSVDTSHPFEIKVGARRISSGNGAIDVRRTGDAVEIAMLKGHATVELSGTSKVAGLEAGQRLSAGFTERATIDTPDLRRVTAWQNGQAIFDGSTLDQAVAEMNRYSAIQIGIHDAQVAALKISGVYQVGDTVAFAESVAAALPVRARRDGDRVVLVAAPVQNLQ